MAIHPRIYIGLGSTGAKIVSKLKQELESRADKETLEWTYFLAITSERDREKGVGSDLDFLSMSLAGSSKTTDVVDTMVLSQRQDPRILDETSKWWYWEGKAANRPWYPPVDNFTTGCGGIRACGRLLFHRSDAVRHKLTGIRDYFSQKYAELSARDEEQAAEIGMNEMVCRVFGLLAGGTCSGLFLDIPFLIKDVFGANTTIAGTYILGDVCQTGNMEASRNQIREDTQNHNTAFALSELSLLQGSNGRRTVLKDGRWPRTLGLNGSLPNGLFDTMAPPYYRVTLVGARSQNDLALNDFNSYIDFVGNYYTRLLLAHADIGQERGDAVDVQAGNAMQADAQFGNRPNTIELIGMLNIKMPKAKLRAIAAEKVITRLSSDDFYNNEPDRYQSCLNHFENQIRWAEFYKQFAVESDDSIKDDSRYSLPDKAAEFNRDWQDMAASLEDYYGRCLRLEHPEVKAKMEDLRHRLAVALDEILKDLLGELPDKRLEMGTLKYLINSLLGTDDGPGIITKALDDCRASIATTRDHIYGPGGTKQVFETTLEQSEKAFPSKMNLLRSRWAGPRLVRNSLTRYRDSIRDLAMLTAGESALIDIIERLRRISVARKLVAKHAGYSVFDNYRMRVDKLLADQQTHDFTNRDVVSEKAELQRLTDSVLTMPIAGRDGSETLLIKASTAIADGWRHGSNGSVSVCGCFKAIMGELDTNPAYASNHRQAWTHTKIQQLVTGLQRSMEASIEMALDQHVIPQIESLSVWDMLKRALNNGSDGVDLETRLRKRFEIFGKSCSLFTKLNGLQDGDSALRKVLNRSFKFFYCRERAINDCIRPLGLDDGTLDRIVRGPEGIAPKLEDTPGSSDLVILYSEVGHDPLYFKGFDTLVEGLLNNPPVIEHGDEKRWSDARFPEWIEEWAQMPR
jgi:hypothetical protein